MTSYATITAAVLSRDEETMLIALDESGTPLNEDLLDEARDKGMTFAGMFGFGVINGVARCKAQSPDDVPAMISAMPAFIEYVRERLAPKPVGDSVAWCESIFKLEDPRDRN